MGESISIVEFLGRPIMDKNEESWNRTGKLFILCSNSRG
ncbi:Hypothetical protein Minf_1322 [Methylacidiphilum infernorum V4]|uniref:Uncharacterized protein n=1 Tax=Methylacidiphilum infernorum (isolate V4) TaxID=481448 RepID=B3DVM3_METI4|nr:Hypothetical protein Minf_1322 [Methylacidiphilum infernorum V4]